MEEIFRNLKGVLSTAVGYAGGTKENPTYEDVCTDETGHAEVVEVEFDPSQIAERVSNLNPRFRTICFVADSARDEWLYHVRFVWPKVWGCDFHLERLLRPFTAKIG